MTDSRSDLLVTAGELAELLASGTPTRVLDVRWKLEQQDGSPAFQEGHVPGAVYVDLNTELAEIGDLSAGRHPLPPVAELQEAARRWGIDDGDTVVVYDDANGLSAARAWWLLTDAGIADVRVLDGAWPAWTDAGLPRETGQSAQRRGNVTLSSGRLGTLSIDEAADFPGTGVLLDARAPERFRGDTEPVDPRAGHIPGALNAPAAGNVDARGRFLPREELRSRFEALGVRDGVPVAVYCGSGVTASANALALTLAGFSPLLFPGSWSQWSRDATRPVAVGAEG